MLAQGQPYSRHHSPGPTQDQVNQRDNNGTTRGESAEPAPHTLPRPFVGDGGGSDENASEFERDMQLEDDDDGEERRHQDGLEEASGNHYLKGSDRSYDTSDEDDENPRPAKRRNLPTAPTDNALTPPDEPTPVYNDDHHTS
ncbi:MAG: hypothetical protein CL912_22810 [Deltaproteobacteria bacterium]|mgnify:CR=1 FL=1|nr:hypothetical protein [Deltaproteobacteria bacterium]